MMKPMKYKLSALLFVALFIFVAPVFSAEKTSSPPPPAALIADFVMTRTISQLKTDLTSEGRLVLGGKGLLRWETLTPAKSTLIINQGQGWIQYPDLNLTKGFDLATDPAMRVMSEHLSLLTSGRFNDAGDLYEVSPEKDRRRILLPKSAEIKKFFKEMQVALDETGAVREVVLISTNGDKTTIVFRNIKANPKLTDDLFSAPKTR